MVKALNTKPNGRGSRNDQLSNCSPPYHCSLSCFLVLFVLYQGSFKKKKNHEKWQQNPQTLDISYEGSLILQAIRSKRLLWLVWLSGLSTGLWTKRSLVRFPVRAHAWVAGQVLSRGCSRGKHTLMFLSPLFPSLPLSLKNK